jgi:hypothetical protein
MQEGTTWTARLVNALAEEFAIDMDRPWKLLTQKQRGVILKHPDILYWITGDNEQVGR